MSNGMDDLYGNRSDVYHIKDVFRSGNEHSPLFRRMGRFHLPEQIMYRDPGRLMQILGNMVIIDVLDHVENGITYLAVSHWFDEIASSDEELLQMGAESIFVPEYFVDYDDHLGMIVAQQKSKD